MKTCECTDMERTAGDFCEACKDDLEREVRGVLRLARISTNADTVE